MAPLFIFKVVVVLASAAVSIVAITMWQSHLKGASAGPPSELIYRTQHLNVF